MWRENQVKRLLGAKCRFTLRQTGLLLATKHSLVLLFFINEAVPQTCPLVLQGFWQPTDAQNVSGICEAIERLFSIPGVVDPPLNIRDDMT